MRGDEEIAACHRELMHAAASAPPRAARLLQATQGDLIVKGALIFRIVLDLEQSSHATALIRDRDVTCPLSAHASPNSLPHRRRFSPRVKENEKKKRVADGHVSPVHRNEAPSTAAVTYRSGQEDKKKTQTWTGA